MQDGLARIRNLDGGKGRILIAEDDLVYRRRLAKRLMEAGHNVVTADNGVEALKIIQETPVELIVSDWMMPEMDGFELCRRVKHEPATESLYFILLTAKDRVDDKVAALDGGADDYVVKNCDEEELLARVRTGLRVHRLHSRLEEVSYTDSLTSLRNRRYYDQRLQEEVGRSRRYYSSLSLILIDLDLFKDVNDMHGHPMGDRVLETAARTITDRVRASEIVCRIGGDEFAVILPSTAASGAEVVAKDLEVRLAETRVQVEAGVDLKIAASIGWADIQAGMNVQELFEAADRSLRARKQIRQQEREQAELRMQRVAEAAVTEEADLESV